MKKDLKSILQRLERIEENQMGQLQGGFVAIQGGGSVSDSFAATNKESCHVTNNCQGSNCVPGCGMNI